MQIPNLNHIFMSFIIKKGKFMLFPDALENFSLKNVRKLVLIQTEKVRSIYAVLNYLQIIISTSTGKKNRTSNRFCPLRLTIELLSEYLFKNSGGIWWYQPGGWGTPKCNMMGRFPFFESGHSLYRKKCISIPCFEIKFPEHNRENNSPLF